MRLPHFPVGSWGRVFSSAGDAAVLKVRVDEAGGGGFLIISAESRGIFDTWVELESDVEAYLSTMEVRHSDGTSLRGLVRVVRFGPPT